MKKVLKSALALSLAFVIIVGVLPATALAADYTATTYDELVKLVAKQFVARNPSFSVDIDNAGDDLISKIEDNEAFWKDVYLTDFADTTADTYYVWGNMEGNKYIDLTDNGSSVEVYFEQEYHTTKEQEDFVDSKITEIMASLNLAGKSDYEKIYAIHNYVIRVTEYDDSLTKSSAYDALQGSVMCNGYALLFYRLCAEAGITAAMIPGQAGEGRDADAHAWNSVYLDGKWYFVDPTWDDPTDSGDYTAASDYFLGGKDVFDSSHTVETDETLFPFLSLVDYTTELANVKYDSSTATPTEPEPEPITGTTLTAVPSPHNNVSVDGKVIAFDAYNINGYTYFKLRDLAYVFNGTNSQFSVTWIPETETIDLSLYEGYTPNGTEMAPAGTVNRDVVLSTHRVTFDGTDTSISAYNIGGNNYYKLRDLAGAIGYGVDFVDNVITIDTTVGYSLVA